MATLSEADARVVAERCLGVGVGVDVEAVTVQAGPYEEQVSGFLGDHLQLLLTVEPGARTLRFFGKTVPRRLDCHADFTRELRCFEKELEFYSSALPRLEAAAAGDEPWAPRCFLARPDILVLEDLAAAGFRSSGCRRPLERAQCEAALAAMARFHAASVLLERQGGGVRLDELFPLVCRSFANFDREEQPMITGWLESGMASLVAVAAMAGVDEDAVRTRLAEIYEQHRRLETPSASGLNVLCHGDGWVNNMLFRGDEVRLVDFQMSRYAPPALDVAILLHMSLPRRRRLAALPGLLAHYYAALARSLRRHDVDVAQVLPWRDLCAGFRQFRDSAVLLAGLNHSLSLMSADVLKTVVRAAGSDGFKAFMTQDRDAAARESFQTDSAFSEWVGDDLRDILDDFVLPDIEEPSIQ